MMGRRGGRFRRLRRRARGERAENGKGGKGEGKGSSHGISIEGSRDSIDGTAGESLIPQRFGRTSAVVFFGLSL
ncbi:hypothetical protein B1729_13270 [Microbacterium sp. B35-04]|nr:hypothetical protein B1729_13270 [Microbacterium sp. B35-04]